MKPIYTLLSLTLFYTAAIAADLRLSDGRVLKDATIASQTPRTVTVKHAAGLTSVAKTLLPADLQASYPVDEAAALVGDKRAADANIAAQEFQRREADRAAAAKTSRNQQTEKENPADLARKSAVVKNNARALAAAYFQQVYNHPQNSVRSFVTITELSPIDNWPGHWRVVGNAYITSASPQTSASTDNSPIGDAAWREFHTESQTSQAGPTFYTRPTAQASYSSFSETKNFEATYTEDPAKPTLDVRVY